MTQNELLIAISQKTDKKLSPDQVKLVMDKLREVIIESTVEGDEIKILGLGTFYSRSHLVFKRKMVEFDGDLECKGGQRRYLRFRPSPSMSELLTKREEAAG
jgi:nucleoid DNA-binding protein